MNGQARWTISEESRQTNRRNVSIGEKIKRMRKPVPRPHETEEEAIIRRFHDAQRMARFRAKKKKAMEEAKALEAAKLSEIAMISELKRRNVVFHIASPPASAQNQIIPKKEIKQENSVTTITNVEQTKYSQLLAVIEEIGRDVRLTYAGSRTSAERLKIGIVQARSLVRDCLLETEINSR